MAAMRIHHAAKLVIAVGVSEVAGVLGSFATASSVSTWYAALEKPVLNPPSWVFGPVWVTLYALMGVAAFLVWKRGLAQRGVKVALVAFGVQLLLNALWSFIFFGLRETGWAFVEIMALWLAIVWTMVVFSRVSKLAARLFVPYILWVSFAAYLNAAIWFLNASGGVT
jgi:translocator protein